MLYAGEENSCVKRMAFSLMMFVFLIKIANHHNIECYKNV